MSLIVDIAGVGYDVQVPLSTFYVLGDAGSLVSLRIHTHVREDTIALFGFATPVELDLFERLIAISGIGPKLALSVLSGIEPGELIRAIRLQDVARLTAIPGIGKKTAERIGLELKDLMPNSRRPPTSLWVRGIPGQSSKRSAASVACGAACISCRQSPKALPSANPSETRRTSSFEDICTDPGKCVNGRGLQ